MSKDKIKNLADGIYENIGGMENVSRLNNCMTRVRINLIDESKVDEASLKKVPGVLGVVYDDNIQVVVGPGTVNKVASEMLARAGVKPGELFSDADGKQKSGKEKVEEKAAQVKEEQSKKRNNNSRFKRALKSLANIFVPLIPAFVGAGIVGGIGSIFTNLLTAGDISTAWEPYIAVMNVIKNGIYSYLTIYVGINAAKEFGGTACLGGVIGGITMLNGVNPDKPLTNLFTGGAISPGQGGIIGVIAAVWILAFLEKKLRKVVPDSLDILVTPTIALLVVGLITIFILMPIAGAVSDGLYSVVTTLINKGGPVTGFILGAGFLPMVMFGLHQILVPIHMEMITRTGASPLLTIVAMGGAGQVGAAIALWLKCKKNKELVEMIKGALPVGIMGIGEPLIYGVSLPLGKPFVTACIGGGIGGAFMGATAVGPSGAALIPLISGGHWWVYVIGLLVGYLGGFVVTYFFGVPDSARIGNDTEVLSEIG